MSLDALDEKQCSGLVVISMNFWAVVVAKLVEWLLPTPEVCGSNPVIGEIYFEHCYFQLHRKDENKEKEAGYSAFKKV